MRERHPPVDEPDDLEILRRLHFARKEQGEDSAELAALRARFPEVAERLAETGRRMPKMPLIPPLPWGGQIWQGVRYPKDGPPDPAQRA